jgi:hypothetical protein
VYRAGPASNVPAAEFSDEDRINVARLASFIASARAERLAFIPEAVSRKTSTTL